MRGSIEDMPITVDIPQVRAQMADCGDIVAEFDTLKVDVDMAPLLKGLPDDRCQCPHYGYILKGRVRINYADHDEEANAGDIYYMAPGHIPFMEAGTQLVMFSPKGAELDRTEEALNRNVAAMLSQAPVQ